MKITSLVLNSKRYRSPLGAVAPPDGLPDGSRWKNDGVFDGGVTWVQEPSGLWVQGFDGVDGIVECGRKPSLGLTTTLSMGCFFYINELSGGTPQFLMGRDDDMDRNYALTIYQDKVYWSQFDGGVAATIQGATTLVARAWYQVAVSYDQIDMRIVLNGDSDQTPVAETGGIDNYNVDFTFGLRPGVEDMPMNGRIGLQWARSRPSTEPALWKRFQSERRLLHV